MKKHLYRIVPVLLPGLLFLCAWEWWVSGDQRLQFLFASPSAILSVAGEELTQAAIWNDMFVTLSEALFGLICGTVLGTLVGLLLWGNGRIDRIAKPYIALIGAIPVFAIAPIMIIWFGIGLLSKVVMAGIAVFFVSLAQAYEGAHAMAAHHLVFARTIGAPLSKAVPKIVIPGAIQWVIAGFRLNVGFSLMGAFIGEFVSSEAGLGHFILKASALYDMPRVLLGVFLLSLLALLMNVFAIILQNIFTYKINKVCKTP